MPELRGEFSALKKEKAILKQTLDSQRYSLHQQSKNVEDELKERIKQKEILIDEVTTKFEKTKEQLLKLQRQVDQINGQNLLLQSQLLKEKELREQEVKGTRQRISSKFQTELTILKQQNTRHKATVEKLTGKIHELEITLEEKELLLEEYKAREEKENNNNKRKLKQAKSARDAVLLTLKQKNQEIQGLRLELEQLKSSNQKEDRFMRTEDRRSKHYFQSIESPKKVNTSESKDMNKQLEELEDFANELLNDDDE